MGSSPSKVKSGCKWSGQMYFDPDASTNQGKDYKLSDDELIAKLKEVIDADEKIDKVWLFSYFSVYLYIFDTCWNHYLVFSLHFIFETSDLQTNSWG